MLVLYELDVTWAHKAIDHESNEPMKVGIDDSVALKNLPAAAVLS
jgi:hypothetical protein